MKEIRIRSKLFKHSVLIGHGILDQVTQWLCTEKITNSFIICDDKLQESGRKLETQISRNEGYRTHCRFLSVSEELKNFHRIYPLFDDLLKIGADRQSCIVALGGGVIGDISGFIASTYLRGIRWIGIPTTLLAQADSSIGGKTGINHLSGKNLIGSFHQPSLVVSDLAFLKTLDLRDRISGLGEIFKYGIVYDPKLFDYLSHRWTDIIRLKPAPLEKALTRCIRWKARIVQKDPYERKQLRETLNFGHTLGHALETATHYQVFRHGEAVILGMQAAAIISRQRSYLSEGSYQQIIGVLSQIPVPKIPLSVQPTELLEIIRKDKKSQNGKTRWILLSEIGKTRTETGIDSEEILNAIQVIRDGTGKPSMINDRYLKLRDSAGREENMNQASRNPPVQNLTIE